MLLDDELSTLVDDLRQAREARKDAEHREAQARDELLARLTEADDTVLVDESHKIVLTASSHVRRGVDSKRLEALYPDVYAAVMSETTVTTVRLP